MIDKAYEADRVAEAIAKTMKVERNSLCFCGSGRKFKKCCGGKSPEDLLFLRSELETAMAYTDSQGGTVKSFPVGIWKKIEEASLGRLKCVYPGCTEPPINSHLIPENILRRNYGDYCMDYRMGEGSMLWQYIRTGVNKAGRLPVFCSKHDNNLFKEVDTLEIDFSSEEQLFLLGLKAIGFSFRRNQYLLGINSQIEIVRPFLIMKHMTPKAGAQMPPIDISQLTEGYIRFKANKDFLEKTAKAYACQRWNFMSHFHRSLPYNGSIFFAGFVNPSHDLEGRRLNSSKIPTAMSCNIFTKDGTLHIILGCPGNDSKAAYNNFLEQLGATDDKTFITAMNNLITLSADKPLLAEGILFSQSDLEKVPAIQQFAAECLRSSDKIFDLKNSVQAIKFI